MQKINKAIPPADGTPSSKTGGGKQKNKQPWSEMTTAVLLLTKYENSVC